MKKWTDRMETPIQAELICYDVNGIHIVFGVTKEKALKLFHFSSAPFDAENLCRKPDNWWPMEGMQGGSDRRELPAGTGEFFRL